MVRSRSGLVPPTEVAWAPRPVASFRLHDKRQVSIMYAREASVLPRTCATRVVGVGVTTAVPSQVVHEPSRFSWGGGSPETYRQNILASKEPPGGAEADPWPANWIPTFSVPAGPSLGATAR